MLDILIGESVSIELSRMTGSFTLSIRVHEFTPGLNAVITKGSAG
jgi:hypothetical protein